MDGNEGDSMEVETPVGLASMYNTLERTSDAVPPNLSTHVADALTPELAKPTPPSSLAGTVPPPSTPSKRIKRAAKRKSIKADKKEKKKLTADLARASLTGSATTSAPSSRKSSVVPPTRHKDFQEVTEFARKMANGCFLIATRCHKNDKELDPMSIIRAWSRMAVEETKPMPALKSAAFYGKDVALEFSSVEDAMAADGTRLPNGGDHRIICRMNRMATAKIYVVRKTSLAAEAAVKTALMTAFPADNFSLYRCVISGCVVDDWAVEFAQPPTTTTRFINFPGTNAGGKGDWSSPVVAAGEVCLFCGGMHEGLAACTGLQFRANSSHVSRPSV